MMDCVDRRETCTKRRAFISRVDMAEELDRRN